MFTTFEEICDLSEVRVDRERRLIENVVLLGPSSKNGRSYPARVASRAVPLYEGAKVFLNHAAPEGQGPRDVRDLAGRVTGPRFDDASGKVRGALRVLPGPNGDLVLGIAESMPDVAGMSHVIEGALSRDRKVVETIHKVRSVDLVADPATTAGMFEQINDDGDHDMTITTEAELRAAHPSLVAEVERGAESRFKESREWRDLKEELEKLRKDLKEEKEKSTKAEAAHSKLREEVDSAKKSGALRKRCAEAGLEGRSVDNVIAAARLGEWKEEAIKKALEEEVAHVEKLTGKKPTAKVHGSGEPSDKAGDFKEDEAFSGLEEAFAEVTVYDVPSSERAADEKKED